MMDDSYAHSHQPTAIPPIKSARPFCAEAAKASEPDGAFRVVIVAGGCPDAAQLPLIIGALSKDPQVSAQIVAAPGALRFTCQAELDDAVRHAWNLACPTEGETGPDWGVRVWEDGDEWSDWRKPGDTVLSIELRHWADMVVVAPCSADMLSKIASGHADSLALSFLRALPHTTPVILCGSMNEHVFAHPYTAKHLEAVRNELGYITLGPQAKPTDNKNPGKMTDWRDIVIAVQDMAALFKMRQAQSIIEAAEAADAEALSAATSSPSNPSSSPISAPKLPSLIQGQFGLFHPVWHEANHKNMATLLDRNLKLGLPRMREREPGELPAIGPSAVDMKMWPSTQHPMKHWKEMSEDGYMARKWWC